MQNYFRDLSQKIFSSLKSDEVLLLNYADEDSDFVRLNNNKIRQAGNVRQQSLELNLIRGKKQNTGNLQLLGDHTEDLTQAKNLLQTLRAQLAFLPEDPYIEFATEIHDSENIASNPLPVANQALDEIIQTAQGLDLVGIWASGSVAKGFANSLGQTNWHTNNNFNFDWSIYHHQDKAIKQNYAGQEWNRNHLAQKITFARETLPVLEKTAVTIKPGKYRVFLAPSAVQELMDMLNWGGFGLKSHRTLQTPLLKMISDNQNLHHGVSLQENNRDGLAPLFTETGFIKPDIVSLIKHGKYEQCLVNARSAREYNQNVNCSRESAQSLELAGGKLHQNEVLKQLDTGVYISNLWYCNYSDRNACRITGMTRFACLWVENGRPVAPLNVMRFDESIYNILGENLLDLTIEHEHILDTGTYGGRSLNSSRLPGALVEDFRFTL